MTSEMDLHSFVESAIVEDQKLDEEEQEAEEESSAPTVPVRRGRAAYENDDMEEDEDERPVRRMAPARRTLPTRRQMAFVSPRLGVLNNSESSCTALRWSLEPAGLPADRVVHTAASFCIHLQSPLSSPLRSASRSSSSLSPTTASGLAKGTGARLLCARASPSAQMGGPLLDRRRSGADTWPMTALRR